jgi:hypothetical protein
MRDGLRVEASPGGITIGRGFYTIKEAKDVSDRLSLAISESEQDIRERSAGVQKPGQGVEKCAPS